MTFEPRVQTFWSEPTGRTIRRLRRFVSSSDAKCPGPFGYHNASAELDIVEGVDHASGDLWTHDDPRWPASCEGCDYRFADADHWQLSCRAEYRNVVTRATFALGDAPPGAMWDADWMGEPWRGPDGITLVVMLPNGGQWMVDAEASNCTRKGDRSHKCWVRHGDPRTEPVTVDKNGETCAAGAGSIMSGDYHGFLRNGIFEP